MIYQWTNENIEMNKKQQRLARYEKLGETMTTKEIAEHEGLSISSVKNYCRYHGIKVKKKPYTVSEKVLTARRKRRKLKENKDGTHIILQRMKKEHVEQRKQEFKELAQDNILCQQWV